LLAYKKNCGNTIKVWFEIFNYIMWLNITKIFQYFV
jgi:hypothetical protein